MGLLVQFKSFFKFLERNKSYTLINVGGLSVSLMFVLLIAVYTVQELSTDQFHENKDHDLYRGFGGGCGYGCCDRL